MQKPVEGVFCRGKTDKIGSLLAFSAVKKHVENYLKRGYNSKIATEKPTASNNCKKAKKTNLKKP